MNLKTVKTFVKDHKAAIVKTGLAVTAVAGLAVWCVISRRNEARSWLHIVPWNDSDKVAYLKKWIANDDFKDTVVLGLRKVTSAEIGELCKQAFVNAGVDEETVIEQVILTTIKEAK